MSWRRTTDSLVIGPGKGIDTTHDPNVLPAGYCVLCNDVDIRDGTMQPRPDPAIVSRTGSVPPRKIEFQVGRNQMIPVMLPTGERVVLVLEARSETVRPTGRGLRHARIVRSLTFESDTTPPTADCADDTLVKAGDGSSPLLFQGNESVEWLQYGNKLYVVNAGFGDDLGSAYCIDVTSMRGTTMTEWPKCRHIAMFGQFLALGNDRENEGLIWFSDPPTTAGQFTFDLETFMPSLESSAVMKLMPFRQQLYYFTREKLVVVKGLPGEQDWSQFETVSMGTCDPDSVRIVQVRGGDGWICFVGSNGMPYRSSGDPYSLETLSPIADGQSPVANTMRKYHTRLHDPLVSGSRRWETRAEMEGLGLSEVEYDAAVGGVRLVARQVDVIGPDGTTSCVVPVWGEGSLWQTITFNSETRLTGVAAYIRSTLGEVGRLRIEICDDSDEAGPGMSAAVDVPVGQNGYIRLDLPSVLVIPADTPKRIYYNFDGGYPSSDEVLHLYYTTDQSAYAGGDLWYIDWTGTHVAIGDAMFHLYAEGFTHTDGVMQIEAAVEPPAGGGFGSMNVTFGPHHALGSGVTDMSIRVEVCGLDDAGIPLDYGELGSVVLSSDDDVTAVFDMDRYPANSVRYFWRITLSNGTTLTNTPVVKSVHMNYRSARPYNDYPSADVVDGRYLLNLCRDTDVAEDYDLPALTALGYRYERWYYDKLRDLLVIEQDGRMSIWQSVNALAFCCIPDKKGRDRILFVDADNGGSDACLSTLLLDRRYPEHRPARPHLLTAPALLNAGALARLGMVTVLHRCLTGMSQTNIHIGFMMDDNWQGYDVPNDGRTGTRTDHLTVDLLVGRWGMAGLGLKLKDDGVTLCSDQLPVTVLQAAAVVVPLGRRPWANDGRQPALGLAGT